MKFLQAVLLCALLGLAVIAEAVAVVYFLWRGMS
jgi:nitrogen fixation-related uncharacterized protein